MYVRRRIINLSKQNSNNIYDGVSDYIVIRYLQRITGQYVLKLLKSSVCHCISVPYTYKLKITVAVKYVYLNLTVNQIFNYNLIRFLLSPNDLLTSFSIYVRYFIGDLSFCIRNDK